MFFCLFLSQKNIHHHKASITHFLPPTEIITFLFCRQFLNWFVVSKGAWSLAPPQVKWNKKGIHIFLQFLIDKNFSLCFFFREFACKQDHTQSNAEQFLLVLAWYMTASDMMVLSGFFYGGCRKILCKASTYSLVLGFYFNFCITDKHQ